MIKKKKKHKRCNVKSFNGINNVELNRNDDAGMN